MRICSKDIIVSTVFHLPVNYTVKAKIPNRVLNGYVCLCNDKSRGLICHVVGVYSVSDRMQMTTDLDKTVWLHGLCRSFAKRICYTYNAIFFQVAQSDGYPREKTDLFAFKQHIHSLVPR